MSRTIPSKSAVASGWKTIAAAPRELIESDVSSVTYAVLIANSRSGAGPASLRRPSSTSKKPIASTPVPVRLARGLKLGLEALQRRDPLLQRGMRAEEARHGLLGLGREDVAR